MQAPGEQLALVSTIDPQTASSSSPRTGDYVDMSKRHSVVFFFSIGDMAAETIDAFVLEATSAAGAGAQTLKAATQLAAHATNNDNVQIVIEVNADDLSPGFRYVAPKFQTGGVVGGLQSCIGVAFSSRNEPASDSDLASVVQIKR